MCTRGHKPTKDTLIRQTSRLIVNKQEGTSREVCGSVCASNSDKRVPSQLCVCRPISVQRDLKTVYRVL
ncbi:hypothetical protein J6590_055206 [Homalodisca vitripennis]|nr:hypothetical protein J6590_055206 [Homalodisca vitripennis]